MEINRTTALLLLIVTLSLSALTVHLVSTNTEFSRYNLGWNGTSLFFTSAGDLRVPEIQEPADLGRKECTVLLLIAPRTDIDASTMAVYRSFLEGGHTLILADDFNGGDALCRGLNVSTRFLSGNLSSLDRETSSPASVIARGSGSTILPGNISSFLLNRPAALEGGEPLMTTSVLSWRDTDGDGRPGEEEVFRRYPVVTLNHVATGNLAVIADASLFINGMRGAAPGYDNDRFITSLLSKEGLCIDQVISRTGEGGFAAGGISLVKHTYIIQLALVATVLFTLAVFWQKGEH